MYVALERDRNFSLSGIIWRTMIGRMTPPKDVHALIPEPLNMLNVNVRWQKGFYLSLWVLK